MYKFCVARQVNEVEALKSMFCGEREFTIIDEEKFEHLKYDVEHKRALQPEQVSQLSVNIKIAHSAEVKNVFVNVKMPSFYPTAEALQAQVFGTTSILNKRQEDALDDAISKFLEARIGQESVLELVQFVREWLERNALASPSSTNAISNAVSNAGTKSGVVTSEVQKSAKSGKRVVRTTAVSTPAVPAGGKKDFRRILVHFCTIAPDRRKTIFEWCKQLRLTGFCRLGSPALVYLEGPAADVDEYLSSLRSFRWKKMELMWEERSKAQSVAEFQKFTAFQEYNVALTELQPYFRQAGIENVFRDSLKIRG